MTASIVLIVWRESVEALLIVGILHAWLVEMAAPRTWLWLGAGAGLATALPLSGVLTGVGAVLPEGSQEGFQATIVLAACALILHMVHWMRRAGPGLAKGLRADLAQASRRGGGVGIAVLAFVAVAREAGETVLFVHGTLSAAPGSGNVLLSIAVALAAAGLTYALLQAAHRRLSWRRFFAITEGALLLLGCALFVSAADMLVGLGVLPYADPLADLSAILDDTSPVGSLVAALTGYRARPDAVILAAWVCYWAAVALILRRESPVAAAT